MTAVGTKNKLAKKIVDIPPEVLEDLSFYGSFTNKEPSELKASIKHENNPRKIVVSEPSVTKYFKSKYFYFTLESIKGIKI